MEKKVKLKDQLPCYLKANPLQDRFPNKYARRRRSIQLKGKKNKELRIEL